MRTVGHVSASVASNWGCGLAASLDRRIEHRSARVSVTQPSLTRREVAQSKRILPVPGKV
jgi:hypothetical protein